MKRITKFSLLLSLVLGLYFPTVFAQSNMTNEMFDLAKLKSGVKNKRISSTDPTGGRGSKQSRKRMAQAGVYPIDSIRSV